MSFFVAFITLSLSWSQKWLSMNEELIYGKIIIYIHRKHLKNIRQHLNIVKLN
jgi:hypothetical protein